MWKTPLFDITFDSKDKKAIEDVLNSGWLTMGERTIEFEQQFAEFVGVRHAIAVTNGTCALHLAQAVLELEPGDEVICPSLTFVAGANSIIHSGGRPVFADIISEENLTIDPADIETKITKNTRAIQVMHYAGYPCDMNNIKQIADKHQLFIIEDCAHSPGAELSAKKCGSIGDIGCFSFFPNKNMTTAEGGMVTTNDDELANKIRLLRSHGMTTSTLDRHKGHTFSYDVISDGYNYRIDELRAALGLAQLKKLKHHNSSRKKIVAWYRSILKDIKNIVIPFDNHNGYSSYHLFPIITNNRETRNKLMSYLKEKKIQTSIHYPPIHLFSYYRKNSIISLPITEKAADRLLTLPLFPAMKHRDVEYICDCICDYFKN